MEKIHNFLDDPPALRPYWDKFKIGTILKFYDPTPLRPNWNKFEIGTILNFGIPLGKLKTLEIA